VLGVSTNHDDLGEVLLSHRIDFIVPGVQKSATTALDSMLRSHKKIQMSKVKETHFFDDDSLNWPIDKYDRYHEYFNFHVNSLIRGEVTPVYMYWPQSLERIRAYNPSIKLIIPLRHPVYRAFSHWRMEMTRNKDTLPFSEAIRGGRARIRYVHRIYSYVERGFYAEQIERVLSLFSRENVHFLKTDELWLDPVEEMSRVTSFLGIDPLPHVEQKYIAPVKSKELGHIAEEDRDYLASLYRHDIEKSEALTALDFSAWLDPKYKEPMVDAGHQAQHSEHA
jgi:hypothetical protein